MSVWNKIIENNSGEGKQAETQGNMIGHERLTFTQISMSRGTEIKSSTANIEKGLTYMYILPWTNLGRTKNDHWAPGSLAGRAGSSLGENDRPELQYLSRWVKIWLAQRVTCPWTSILGLAGRVWRCWARISTPIREYGYLIMFLREYYEIPHFSGIETPWVLGRDSWRLLGVLENSLFSFLGFFLHPWRFYPFWVGEDDGLQNWRRRCEWEV